MHQRVRLISIIKNEGLFIFYKRLQNSEQSQFQCHTIYKETQIAITLSITSILPLNAENLRGELNHKTFFNIVYQFEKQVSKKFFEGTINNIYQQQNQIEKFHLISALNLQRKKVFFDHSCLLLQRSSTIFSYFYNLLRIKSRFQMTLKRFYEFNTVDLQNSLSHQSQSKRQLLTNIILPHINKYYIKGKFLINHLLITNFINILLGLNQAIGIKNQIIFKTKYFESYERISRRVKNEYYLHYFQIKFQTGNSSLIRQKKELQFTYFMRFNEKKDQYQLVFIQFCSLFILYFSLSIFIPISSFIVFEFLDQIINYQTGLSNLQPEDFLQLSSSGKISFKIFYWIQEYYKMPSFSPQQILFKFIHNGLQECINKIRIEPNFNIYLKFSLFRKQWYQKLNQYCQYQPLLLKLIKFQISASLLFLKQQQHCQQIYLSKICCFIYFRKKM
ncbi:unnamed protein product (macronuclear) [Paramecium tetraurelia]|uniref:Transmembrane protein n=1 Tax=Paramecium tetraurelia TaxID=5888 RepID=A0D425_PARTE|nr:uncharacterized protein GSPATT00013257001 [Paramecium tetraurelia]CAK77792.1 unnamed protein product [Paramecium tetraurelia]|eukprot:XP_001445189.1 hypothetical protein (macronuclear) [Paramecium tetraurelia strain d4-2]